MTETAGEFSARVTLNYVYDDRGLEKEIEIRDRIKIKEGMEKAIAVLTRIEREKWESFGTHREIKIKTMPRIIEEIRSEMEKI